MKKISLSVGLIAILFFVTASFANSAVWRSGPMVSVPEDSVVKGDFYARGNDVFISGVVDGDVYVLGNSVTINGVIKGDLVVVGMTVAVHGAVTGDVRIVGAKVTISNKVGEDLLVGAKSLSVLSSASVGGDLLFYGERADVTGAVKGSFQAQAGSLMVGGAVGSIDVAFQKSFELGSRAQVAGDVSYVSNNDILRSPEATVGGAINGKKETVVSGGGLSRMVLLYWFTVLFSALTLVLLLRERISEFLMFSQHTLRLSSLFGVGVVLLVPALSTILIVSVLGLPLGIFLLSLYISLLVFSFVLLHVLVGAWLAKLVTKKYEVSWLWTIAGVVVAQGILLLPWIGALIFFAGWVSVVGMVLYHVYLSLRR